MRVRPARSRPKLARHLGPAVSRLKQTPGPLPLSRKTTQLFLRLIELSTSLIVPQNSSKRVYGRRRGVVAALDLGSVGLFAMPVDCYQRLNVIYILRPQDAPPAKPLGGGQQNSKTVNSWKYRRQAASALTRRLVMI